MEFHRWRRVAVGQFIWKANGCERGGVLSDVIGLGGARRTRYRRAPEERTVVARVSSSMVRD